MKEKVLVLDFGGQYTQLIAKAVRKCGVFSEIQDCNYDLGDILRDPPKGIILSGGPDSVYERGAPYVNAYLFELGIPVLGICYGMQHVNHLLGGQILHGEEVIKEYGETEVGIEERHQLFQGLEGRITAWMSHGDSVDGDHLAQGFKVVARTKDHVAAIADDNRKIYGVQFHPEVTHTPQGTTIVSNFVHLICGCGKEWTMDNYIEECKQYVKDTVGKSDVVCFVSGGVDSSFVATLLAQTEGIGRVYPVYIEALMRRNETEEVAVALNGAGVNDLTIKRAEDRFIGAVAGMSDPEEKRKAIGNLFGELMQETCEDLGLDKGTTYLAQGTLYTDLIESGRGVGKKAATIKSHHNVGCSFIDGLKAAGRVVEPNRLIFKDEVRAAAREIGLPPEISERQPFPGPGLGIRIVSGSPRDTEEEELRFHEWSDRVSFIAEEEGLQGFALPIKTVGVQGDERTYSYLALLRGERDWQKIRRAAKRIPTEVKGVNRVVFDLGQEFLRKDYLEQTLPTIVNRETVDLLKDIDDEGRKIIDRYGFTSNIAQTIFIICGADIYNSGKRTAVLRAVSTDDFMTVSPVGPDGVKMSWECMNELHETLLEKYDVGAFLVDLTDKPPATTCWE